MKKITNTSKNPNLGWLGGGNPDAIEAQESRGQEELVKSSSFLPTDSPDKMLSYIVSQGGKVGLPLEDDPIFLEVTLPEGWSIVPFPDHSMWSKLLDKDGEVVADIFYKAAFYDRKAHSHFKRGE